MFVGSAVRLFIGPAEDRALWRAATQV